MIEIQHQYDTEFDKGIMSIEGLTTYIDEKQITFITDPYFYSSCFSVGKRPSVPEGGWKFQLGVSGTTLIFKYQNEAHCRGFFEYLLQCLREKSNQESNPPID